MLRRIALSAGSVLLLGAGSASAQLPPGSYELPEPSPLAETRAPLARVVARPGDDARAISRGLTRAVRDGRLSRAAAREHRVVVHRTLAVLKLLPRSRATTLVRVLHQVRRQAGIYTRPRALALFSMLDMNASYLAANPLPRDGSDVAGPDGVVYRVGWGYGLQFHPLANVIRLNNHIQMHRTTKALRLAQALRARAVHARGRAVWEYYFPYGGGAPPWTSGMAQAIGAQAFARAAHEFAQSAYFELAGRAFRSIPGRLTRAVSTGPWVRLYGFSDLVVLNAQLQAALSLADYGRLAPDAEASDFAARLEAAAQGLLDRFDTGFWTRYALGGREAPLVYHRYHVDLARWLGIRLSDQFWRRAGQRFQRYAEEPPQFRAGGRLAPLYPWPAEGFRDRGTIRFWLSKISRVTFAVGGTVRLLGYRSQGWHSYTWSPGRRSPGSYRPRVSAVDLAGNSGSARLAPVVIAVDRTPPRITTQVSGRTLRWQAEDAGTPWLRMTLVLNRNERRRHVSLGRRPLAGTVRLSLPRGYWKARLFVADSSGNRTRVALGVLPPRE